MDGRIMAKMNFQTVCPCGAKVSGSVKKPNRFANAFTKVNCAECGSRFLLTCMIKKEVKGRRVFMTQIDLLEISDETKQKLSGELGVKAKAAVARVKNSFGIEPKPDKSVIETEMD